MKTEEQPEPLQQKLHHQQQQQRDHSKSGQPSAIGMAASVVTHLLLLLPVLYIVGLGFESYKLFSWHPICMSLGAGLLIVEGVYTISGEAFATKKLNRSSRATLHWILHSAGLCLLVAGLAVVIVNKDQQGKPHLASPHSQLGVATLVISCLVAAFGVLALNARLLYPRARPLLLKVVHSYAGIGLTVLLLATVITGTYTGWWAHIGASKTGRDLVFASLFFAGLFVLVKPVIGAVARTRVLLRKPAPPPPLEHPVGDVLDSA